MKIKSLAEVYGYKRTRPARNVSAGQLRSLVLEEYKATLFEHTVPDAGADINDMDAEAVWDIMVSEDPEQADPIIQSMLGATKWASKVVGDYDAAKLKSAAEEIWGVGDAGKKVFITRVGDIVTKLGAAEGFEKKEMPAFEGGDAAVIDDALDEPGDINIDIGADWGGDTENFEEFAEEEEETNESARHRRSSDNLIMERWGRLAGLNEISADPRFPFVGSATVMPGAPNLGADGDIDVSAIKGQAKKFLTKGKGNTGDDIDVQTGATLNNGQMKPTQKNVKAAKSLLFAFGNSGEDMGGAFADSDGNIIDGHHRWSGQYLRTGGNLEHSGVNLVAKPSGMDTKEFLTMLTVLGTALGRPTKLK